MTPIAQTEGANRFLRELLREKRLSIPLKQSELAKMLGQYQSFVSKYESGERRLDVIELQAVCDALGTTVYDLLEDLKSKQRDAANAAG